MLSKQCFFFFTFTFILIVIKKYSLKNYARKTIFLFMLFSISKDINSQYNSEFLKYSDYGKHVSLYSESEFNSNSINNDFLDKIIFGGFIADATKQNVSKKIKDMNYFGGNFNYGINVFFGKDSSKFKWVLGLKDQQFANSNFTRDFFNIAFYGNTMYKGKTAYFDNSSIAYSHFQELKFGFIVGNDSTGKTAAALSVLKGQNMFQFGALGTNSLFTASDATQLDLNANFTMHTSNVAKNNFNAINGIGFSIDLFAETPYTSFLGKSKFILNVSNFGFINWNKNTKNYSVDSLFHFSGFAINSIHDLKDTTLNAINKDTLVNHITHLTSAKYNLMLPMNLVLIHQIDFSERFSLRTGIRHIFNGNYKPFLFAEAKYTFKSDLNFGGLLAFGGYGKLTLGSFVEYNFKKMWLLKIGSNCIQGFIIRSKTIGQSLYFTFVKKL